MIIRNQVNPIIISLMALLIVGCSQPIQEIIISPTFPPPAIIPASATITPSPIPTETPAPTYTPLPTLTSTQTPAPEPIEVVKVMQYNIVIGGAVTPWCKQIRLKYDGWEGESTFESALEIIEAADPDILIVNEACDWKLPNISDYVVNKLDMNDFFIGEDFIDGVAPVALFTKHKIIESESLRYSEQINEETIFRGIKVRVQTSNGNELILFGVHLNPFPGKDDFHEYKKEQVKWLAELIKPIINENIILAGDMNSWYEALNPILGEIGLTGLGSRGINQRWASEFTYPIDLIWISPSLKFEAWSQNLDFYKELDANHYLWELISDHNPEAAVIGIYPP